VKPCRVLVVDDSPTMRALISSVLRRDPDIVVVGEAADPLEAREAIKRLDPDVVTLDIEMPKMNGLDFLERIMRLRPTRVIIVSTLTEKGAATSIRALEMGAYDCLPKPSVKNLASFNELAERVKSVAMTPPPSALASGRGAALKASETPARYHWDGRAVFIGSSMGGVEALFTLLAEFPESCPPTVITQHMPALFTKSFAERLNRLCKPSIAEASDGAVLAQGHVYVAPGGNNHLQVERAGGNLRCRLRAGELVSGHRPSIDVMFRTAASAVGDGAVGVILTGMGRDGASGLLAMREAGAETFGQDEASSLIYGMPKVAMEIGAVGKQLSLARIAPHILQVTNTASARETCHS
jgi:two-component system, chemotaxis family, protein-glutamate methylesterase/glutaminase